MPNWCFKGFNLKGQSNYAFNLILKEPDEKLMNNLQKRLEKNEIEFRRGSAGGGNQMRQPYVRESFKFTDARHKENCTCYRPYSLYGMYLGNYPELSSESIKKS